MTRRSFAAVIVFTFVVGALAAAPISQAAARSSIVPTSPTLRHGASEPTQSCFQPGGPNPCASTDPTATLTATLTPPGDYSCTFDAQIDWGNGRKPESLDDVVVSGNSSVSYAKHTYTKPGTFAISAMFTVVAGNCGSGDVPYTFTYSGPLSVNAGPDQTVLAKDTTTLDGSVSGSSPTTLWSQVAGPGTSTFADPASPATAVTISASGTYQFQLSASDASGQTASGTVAIAFLCADVTMPLTNAVCIAQSIKTSPQVWWTQWPIPDTTKIPYSFGAGHLRETPGPSYGTCKGPGDPFKDCVARSTNVYGLDCSGFTRWVYDLAYSDDVLGFGNAASQAPRTTLDTNQSPTGPTQDLGDLVFFWSKKTRLVNHVGVYVGNGMMVVEPKTGFFLTEQQVSVVASASSKIQYRY